MKSTIKGALRLPFHGAAIAGAAALLSLGAMAPAVAQSTPPSPEAGQTDISDAKIDAFVAALQEVEEVRQIYTPQLEAAESETERKDLTDSANEEIIQRIDATPDLSVDEYIQIAQIAQQDPALNERIVTRFKAAVE
ncbi:DUF4168 domain-containing protein [Cribrihabitans sp. XS_ASV171]